MSRSEKLFLPFELAGMRFAKYHVETYLIIFFPGIIKKSN